jgi:uncharacterized membrane protein
MLALAFWLHMAATIIWIGGLFFQSVILAPALSRIDDPAALLERLQNRFQPLAWLSLAVLVGTGLVQMSANANYEGVLAISNAWSRALLAKHLTIGLMFLIAAYQTWVLQPRLARLAMLNQSGQLQQRYSRLAQINLALGILVLGLTALARTV